MEDTAYLFGQILKISDSLHEFYCEIKREGEVPPQLVGNSVFVSAMEMPVRSFALLGARMKPYISWAKQYRHQEEKEKKEEKEGSPSAGYLLSLYERNMTKLYPLFDENIRFSDFEKAQLFIGYLAEFPRNEKDKEA